jgi:predicted kinase
VPREAVLFSGVPAAGKSSFYRERFFTTHVRVSLDLLKTRSRERQFLETCFATRQRFVVDNTNPSRADRSRYIELAKARNFTVTGYYFESNIDDCMKRNAARLGAECVPNIAIVIAANRLEVPSYDEGFDRLHYVRLAEGGFIVEEWRDGIA